MNTRLPRWRSVPFFLYLTGLAIGWNTPSGAGTYTFHYEDVLGTSCELIVETKLKADAKNAKNSTLAEIDRLSSILSTYDPQSEINRWLNMPKGSPWHIPKEIIELLVACDWWSIRTNGVFNPQIGTLSKIWETAALNEKMPDPLVLQRAHSKIQSSAWEIDGAYEMVTLNRAIDLNLNAIAKGYIIDKSCEAALESSEDIEGVLLSIGGDLRIMGTIEKTVGITDPLASAENAPPLTQLILWDHAVATSANYERGYNIQDTYYSHILDPRTGYPASNEILSTTVLSDSAIQADVLSTSLMVLTPEEGIQLIESLPDTECLLVCRDEQVRKSSGFSRFQIVKDETAAKESWDGLYPLELNFEINRPGGRRYLRPYVAVWIENETGQVEKTLCLWMERVSKWISKLTRWNRTQGLEQKTVHTLTRVTRRPGNYRLTWDGTNDYGDRSPPGNYTLLIAAVREHGTHQLIRETF